MCASFACNRPALHLQKLEPSHESVIIGNGFASVDHVPFVLARLPALCAFLVIADVLVLVARALPLPD